MEYIELAYNIRELYPGRRIMLVYANDTERNKAVSLANDSGSFEKIDTKKFSDYNIVGKTDGIIDIVSVSAGFAGGWSEVTDIWYDESIPDEQIRKLKNNVLRRSPIRDSVVTIPFLRSSLHIHLMKIFPLRRMFISKNTSLSCSLDQVLRRCVYEHYSMCG